MKSSKLLYSVYFSEYKLSEEVTKKLHNTLFEMFLDMKEVCDKHDIKYMMSGGTVLGAVRHKGFIPWDDDIDIMMLREEYEKFKNIFKQELSNKYELAEPLVTENYFSKMPKIYKKGTEYVEITTAGIESNQMVFIDIFIIENIPDNIFVRKIKGAMYDLCFRAASVCIDYLYPSPVILEKCETEREVKNYYNFRRKLGFVFSHIGGIKFYLKMCDKLGKSKKESKFLGIPSDSGFHAATFDRSMYTEIDQMEFCGVKVNVPQNYHTYLQTFYGDYMEIPPVEKRENHIAAKVKL